jgi:hypothetical protein
LAARVRTTAQYSEPGESNGVSLMPDTRYRETRSMPVRFQIAALIFMMVQGVLFGVGIVTILATPLSAWAMQLIPALVVVTLAVSIPVSWMIAPRLRLRHRKATQH